MNNVLKTFTNAEDGIATEIVAYQGKGGGFAVALKDTDADEYLPEKKIFPTMAAAEVYAKAIVEGRDPAAELKALAS